MSVRAKMYVTQIAPAWDGAPDDQKKITLSCQYDPEVAEDQRFCTATPSGTATYLINNPKAVEQFAVGDAYYVDFTPVKS